MNSSCWGIIGIASSLPKRRLVLEDIIDHEAIVNENADSAKALGVREVRFARTEHSVELGIEAARKLLQETDYPPAELGMILFCQPRAPEKLMTSEALRVQYELGATKALTFSIADLGCASSSSALMIAAQFKERFPCLIVSGSTPFGNYRIREDVTILGDGGVAALMGPAPDIEHLVTKVETNGKYWNLYEVEYRDTLTENWRELTSEKTKYSFELAAESRNRFRDMIGEIRNLFPEHNPLYHHVIMQNISLGAYKFYESALDVHISKVCHDNLSRFGHLGAGDIFVNLREGLMRGVFQNGQRILVLNNSPSAAWGVSLLEVK